MMPPLITFLHPSAHHHRGWSANVILVLFYLSPLATLWGVLRRRDASSIHWPLALMTVINGLLWVFYGLAMSDAFIWAPNAFGALVGGMNLLLRCLFPARKSRCVDDVYGYCMSSSLFIHLFVCCVVYSFVCCIV